MYYFALDSGNYEEMRGYWPRYIFNPPSIKVFVFRGPYGWV